MRIAFRDHRLDARDTEVGELLPMTIGEKGCLHNPSRNLHGCREDAGVTRHMTLMYAAKVSNYHRQKRRVSRAVPVGNAAVPTPSVLHSGCRQQANGLTLMASDGQSSRQVALNSQSTSQTHPPMVGTVSWQGATASGACSE